MFSFFLLSFKKCNKLDDCIYTYFFIISIILITNNFFYNKDCCLVSLKNKNLDYIFFVVLLVSLNYIFMVSLICYNLKTKTFIFIFLLLIKIKIL